MVMAEQLARAQRQARDTLRPALDALRKEFLGPDAKLVILEDDREVLATVETNWYAHFDKTFARATVLVDDQSTDFADNLRSASSVTVTNSVKAILNNRIFEVERETTPPLGSETNWKLRAKATGKTYIPPEEP